MKWLPGDAQEWCFTLALLVYFATDIWLSRRRSKKYREERKRIIEEFEAERIRRRDESQKQN
ncbi:MAG: hypothetical protein Q7S36_01140 [Candidatus Liptonbacteria bacterium]|nr:hypothetical protein [Candidatus Liptonbacteria bacterium]